mmetsp:Transcript_80244/g.221894  ORF Transcript_80244/g.221894 Transcript_80244/m.221894 type:complete len:666 (-) Transcript_80244:136-2133(-)
MACSRPWAAITVAPLGLLVLMARGPSAAAVHAYMGWGGPQPVAQLRAAGIPAAAEGAAEAAAEGLAAAASAEAQGPAPAASEGAAEAVVRLAEVSASPAPGFAAKAVVAPSEDRQAMARIALQESFTQPDPTALGILDSGALLAAKDQLQRVVYQRLFHVPWWGWLIFAGILVFMSASAFGLGTWYSRSGVGKLDRFSPGESTDLGGGGIRGLAKLAGQAAADRLTRPSLASSSSAAALPAAQERRSLLALTDQRGSSKDSAAAPQVPFVTPAVSSAASSRGKCLPCLPHQCGNLFTKAVRKAIASVDKKVLGVQLSVGHVHVNARSGLVEVHDVILYNPEGYHSEYLLKVKRLVMQISMAKYIFSRGKNVIVENLDIVDVDVIYEKALTTSNIEYVINFATARGEGEEEEGGGTVTGSILGAIADTTSTVTAAAGSGARASLTRLDSAKLMRRATESLQTVAEGIPARRVAGSGAAAVTDTVTDVVETGAGAVGLGVLAATSAVASTAMALETGLTSGARGITSTATSATASATRMVGGAVGLDIGASSSSGAPAPSAEAAAAAAKQKPDVVLKRLSITGIGVMLASNMVGGRGVRFSCGDIVYQDFTSEVAVAGGLDIVRYLLKTVLLNAIKSMASIGDFTLDTTNRVLNIGRAVTEEVRSAL